MFAENVSAFLDSTSGHALDATYDPSGANAAVKVILDLPYGEFEAMSGTHPTATGKASDFPTTCVNKQLVIGSTTYVIRGREPVDDGTFVHLILEV